MFDLIYTGRSYQAREIIDKTWPGDEESKLLFIENIKDMLKSREYYDAIVELNKPYNTLENEIGKNSIISSP